MKTPTLTQKPNAFTTAIAELNALLKLKQTLALVRFSLIVLGVAWISLGIFYGLLPPQVPLLYSRPWGESQLVFKQYFFLIPAILTLLFVIHIRVASLYVIKNIMFTLIILWTQTLIEILTTIALLKLIVLLS